jgi:hypothetical protein
MTPFPCHARSGRSRRRRAEERTIGVRGGVQAAAWPAPLARLEDAHAVMGGSLGRLDRRLEGLADGAQ